MFAVDRDRRCCPRQVGITDTVFVKFIGVLEREIVCLVERLDELVNRIGRYFVPLVTNNFDASDTVINDCSVAIDFC